jgi:hypothetical protein
VFGCHGKGVAVAWLEVVERQRVVRAGGGDPGFTSPTESLSAENVEAVFSWSGRLADAPQPAKILVTTAPVACDSRTDRVQAATVTRWRSEVGVVSYELAGVQGAVDVQAWNGVIAADRASGAPFEALRRRLKRGASAALLLSLMLLGWFVSRHPYFAQSSAARFLTVLAVVLPAVLGWPLAYSALPNSRRRRATLAMTSVPAIVAVLLQVSLAATGPSVVRATELRQRGETVLAMREAAAAVELQRDVDAAAKLHDDMQAEVLAAAINPVTVWSQLASARFFTKEAQADARRRAIDLTATRASSLQTRGEYQQSLALIAEVPIELRAAEPLQERVRAADGHEIDTLWITIRSRNALAERYDACQKVVRPLTALGDAIARYAKASPTAVKQTCVAVVAEEHGRLRREEQRVRAAQAQAEREARASRLREERAVQARQSSPLQCRDGYLVAHVYLRRSTTRMLFPPRRCGRLFLGGNAALARAQVAVLCESTSEVAAAVPAGPTTVGHAHYDRSAFR